jgi:hydrogenase/urease accessory protein HupE
MKNSPVHRSILAVALLAAPWRRSALGHGLQGEANGFLTGLLHPLSGAGHVLRGAGTVAAVGGVFFLWKAVA